MAHPFQKLGGILKAVAPTLLKAVGGPGAAIALTIAKKALGGEGLSDDALTEAVEAATTTPEGIQKLREIEADLKKTEGELGFKFEQLATQDRADARAREIAMGGQGDHTTRNLAYVMIFAFIAVALGVLMGFAKVESALAGTIVGYMVGEAKQVIAYYFGSSSGSKAKTDLLSK